MQNTRISLFLEQTPCLPSPSLFWNLSDSECLRRALQPGGPATTVLLRFLFWYDTNNALLIYVDFLLSNVQISVFNPFLDFEILCKTPIWPGRSQCQNPGRTTRQAPFPLFQFVINRASFRPLFLSTSDRDLFTFTKGVKNYNSSVLLQFRGGIRPARRHPRWCAQSFSRRHRWQGHHPRCHQQGEFTFACGFGLIVAFANSAGEQRSALWGGDKVQGPAVQGKQDMCCNCI